MSIGTTRVRVHRKLLLGRAVYDHVLEIERAQMDAFPPNL